MGYSAKYFYVNDNESATLHNRISVDITQLDQARTKKDELLSYIKPQIKDSTGHDVKHWLQGSYKNSTLVRPISKGMQFDIDVGLYLFCNAENEGLEAKDVKQLNLEILNEFANQSLGANVEPSKKNCERIAYSPHFHIDIPIYFLDKESNTCRLATENNGWIDSDPKAIQDWFDKSVSSLDTTQLARLRRIIRYLKTWIALKWKNKDDGTIPSLAITVLTVRNYVDEIDDEDAFVSTFMKINEKLQSNFSVKSPINNDDILNLSGEQIDVAKERFNALSKLCQYIKNHHQIENYLAWNGVFEHMFPPCIENIHSDEIKRYLPALSNPPKIRAKQFDKSNKIIENTIDKAVTAFKNENLYFSVANKQDYLSDCEVRWTVRNQGEEAGRINDLGHAQFKTTNDEIHETCVYNGIHYVDCLVLKNGEIFGFNTLKVHINGFSRPLRNPKKNRYGAK